MKSCQFMKDLQAAKKFTKMVSGQQNNDVIQYIFRHFTVDGNNKKLGRSPGTKKDLSASDAQRAMAAWAHEERSAKHKKMQRQKELEVKRSKVQITVASRMCFARGTDITMAAVDSEGKHGTKPIEDVKVGDWVLSFDVQHGQFRRSQVARTTVEYVPVQPPALMTTPVVQSAFVEHSTNATVSVQHTPGHRFWMRSGHWGTVESRADWVDRHPPPQGWNSAQLNSTRLNNAVVMKLGDAVHHVSEEGHDRPGVTLVTFQNSSSVHTATSVHNLEMITGSHTFIANGMIVDAIGGIWRRAGLVAPPPGDWYYQDAHTPPFA